MRHAICKLAKLDNIDNIINSCFYFCRTHFALLQSKCYIVPYTHVRKYRIVLEHHRNIAPVSRQVADRLTIDKYITCRLAVKTSNCSQESGFATTRWAQKGKKRATRNIYVNVGKRYDRAVELLQSHDFYRCHIIKSSL